MDAEPNLEEELEYAFAAERRAWDNWYAAQDHRRKIQEALLKRNASSTDHSHGS